MTSKMHLLILIGAIVLWTCARPVAPVGGKKDEEPPILLPATSSPLLATRFVKKPIVLNFNEWLKSGNAQQIIVSPPLRYSPKVSTRGKTVSFEFNALEELKENTTYVINFGNYISDLNEGNILKNFSYVFSTGEVIDSLSIRVKINDLSSKAETEGVVTMLYDSPRDSNIIDRMPLYVGFTEKGGVAEIQYIKPGIYYLYALLDKNFNYQFNGGEEKVGFYMDSVVVSKEPGKEYLLNIGKEDPLIAKPIHSGKAEGKAEFTYNQEPGSFSFGEIPDSLRFSYRKKAEKLEIFHSSEQPLEWNLVINNGWGKSDTFAMRSGPEALGFKKEEKIQAKQETQRLGLRDDIERILFPIPLIHADSLLLRLKIQDGKGFRVWGNEPLHALDSLGWWLDLQAQWLTDTLYQLEILPGGITSIYGDKNRDTLILPMVRRNWEAYGSISIKMEDLDTLAQYLYFFLRGEEELDKGIINGLGYKQLEFKRLLPGKYRLKMVRDENRNGMQDKGRVLQRQKPEQFIIRDLDELRADWDLELNIRVEEALKSGK
jgi:hypothetical protein